MIVYMWNLFTISNMTRVNLYYYFQIYLFKKLDWFSSFYNLWWKLCECSIFLISIQISLIAFFYPATNGPSKMLQICHFRSLENIIHLWITVNVYIDMTHQRHTILIEILHLKDCIKNVPPSCCVLQRRIEQRVRYQRWFY